MEEVEFVVKRLPDEPVSVAAAIASHRPRIPTGKNRFNAPAKNENLVFQFSAVPNDRSDVARKAAAGVQKLESR